MRSAEQPGRSPSGRSFGARTITSQRRVVLANDATEADARAAALADRNVQSSLEGKTIVKLIYVPGRVLNLVVR